MRIDPLILLAQDARIAATALDVAIKDPAVVAQIPTVELELIAQQTRRASLRAQQVAWAMQHEAARRRREAQQ